jgi:hypothetical protein
MENHFDKKPDFYIYGKLIFWKINSLKSRYLWLNFSKDLFFSFLPLRRLLSLFKRIDSIVIGGGSRRKESFEICTFSERDEFFEKSHNAKNLTSKVLTIFFKSRPFCTLELLLNHWVS